MAFALQRPGLLIVDMQVGFVSPEGAYARAGRPIRDAEATVRSIVRLREAFRVRGLPRWYTAYRYRDDGSDYPARIHGILPSAYARRRDPVFVSDSAETTILPALAPIDDETVVHKNRYSGFLGTRLDEGLREAGVQTVVVTGVLSHVCVDATAREAFSRDFDVVVVRDAVAGVDDELHRAALRNLEETVGAVVDVDEVLRALDEAPNA